MLELFYGVVGKLREATFFFFFRAKFPNSSVGFSLPVFDGSINDVLLLVIEARVPGLDFPAEGFDL